MFKNNTRVVSTSDWARVRKGPTTVRVANEERRAKDRGRKKVG